MDWKAYSDFCPVDEPPCYALFQGGILMKRKSTDMFDEYGYLKNRLNWDEDVAGEIAQREGVKKLDEPHWQIIRYLQKYYSEFDTLPLLRRACNLEGKRMSTCLSCYFRDDPLKAVKIAGLPYPGDEIATYYQGYCNCKNSDLGMEKHNAITAFQQHDALTACLPEFDRMKK